jgi:hypothetical protein
MLAATGYRQNGRGEESVDASGNTTTDTEDEDEDELYEHV